MVEFDADLDRPAVDDEIDAAGKIACDMRGRGRRDVAGEIRRRRHHSSAECAQDVARHGVRWNAYRHCVEARGGEIGHRATLRLRQHQRQRAGPEGFREAQSRRIEARDFSRGCEVADMRNQRVEGGAALGLVEVGDRRRVGGISPQAINGLGRERDQPATGQGARGGGDGGLAGGQNRRFQGDIHQE